MYNQIIIPEELCKDFLGIMILDVLHDSKGKNYLYGTKLSQLTELISTAIALYNNIDSVHVNNYIFKHVLAYFCDLWRDNLSALGLHVPPDFNNSSQEYWDYLKQVVIVPFRNVGDRYSECTFATLGKGKPGVESYNYAFQKEKLVDVEFLSFVSPHGIKTPQDYYIQAHGIVDIIQARSNSAKVVLDMKSSAGLIRTITDPIGYITSLATYADPGYNMPGMSAIRKWAKATFEENKTHEFKYMVYLNTPFGKLKLLDVTYFYGIAQKGLNHSNVIINILDNHFNGSLPRSVEMSDALSQYVRPKVSDITFTTAEMIEKIYEHIKNYSAYTPPEFEKLDHLLIDMHKNNFNKKLLLETLKELKLDAVDIYRVADWIFSVKLDQQIGRLGYIIKTVKNIYYYNQTVDFILPLPLIKGVLPQLIMDYKSGKGTFEAVGFTYHQLHILDWYARYPDNCEKNIISNAIDDQWLPMHVGKLTVQTVKFMKQLTLLEDISPFKGYIDEYFTEFLKVCQNNLWAFSEISNAKMFEFLCMLPTFQPPVQLQEILKRRLQLYNPSDYYNSQYIDIKPLLLNEILAIINDLVDIDFNRQWTFHLFNETPVSKLNALYYVLGKFSGDFGQILWSLFHGHIFATEDNNASAMALFLHRLPKNKRWVTVHGLGDGSSVDVTIS